MSKWLAHEIPELLASLEERVADLRSFIEEVTGGESSENEFLLTDDGVVQFIEMVKDIRRLEIQIEQRTEMTHEERNLFEAVLPREFMLELRGEYLDMVCKLEDRRKHALEELKKIVLETDFDLVLFSSALFDRTTVMSYLSRILNSSLESWTDKKQELILSIRADSNFLKERDDLVAFVETFDSPSPNITESLLEEMYEKFKNERMREDVAMLAEKHGVSPDPLKEIVEYALERNVLDYERIGDLFLERGLGWKERARLEDNLARDLSILVEMRRCETPLDMGR